MPIYKSLTPAKSMEADASCVVTYPTKGISQHILTNNSQGIEARMVNMKPYIASWDRNVCKIQDNNMLALGTPCWLPEPTESL